MKIKIGDKEFEIILEAHRGKDTGSNFSGSASHWFQKIWLDLDERPFGGIESDLWHEIVEMINQDCDFKFDHHIITVLGNSIHQVLIDNKEFLDKFEEMVCQSKLSPK